MSKRIMEELDRKIEYSNKKQKIDHEIEFKSKNKKFVNDTQKGLGRATLPSGHTQKFDEIKLESSYLQLLNQERSNRNINMHYHPSKLYLGGKDKETLIADRKEAKVQLEMLSSKKLMVVELQKQLSEMLAKKLEGSNQIMEAWKALAAEAMSKEQSPRKVLEQAQALEKRYDLSIKRQQYRVQNIEAFLRKFYSDVPTNDSPQVKDQPTVPDSGTMKLVTDKKIVKNYIDGLNKVYNIKCDFISSNLRKQENSLIVDIGCMTGKVLHEVCKSNTNIRGEGIDIDQRYIDQAKQDYPELEFKVGNPSKGLPYEDNTVSTFSMLSVIHEIYTYNDFSEKSVKDTLREMYRALRPGGRVLLREPVMPQNPDELLHITLTSENGANPDTNEALLEKHPRDLSAHSLMKRFLCQFKVLQLDRNQYMKHQIIQNPDGSYELPAWLIGEFLRKRTFNDESDHWNAEMGEHNAPFTSGDIAKLAQETGFQENKMRIQTVFEPGFYGEIKKNDGIIITDANEKKVAQAERFPSHIYAILEKE